MLTALLVAVTLSQARLDRALWMWHAGPILQSVPVRRSFFDFVEAPKGDPDHRITVIFLGEVDPSNSAQIPLISGLLQECHSKGMMVHFLCGESEWARLEKNGIGVGMVDKVLRYNASQPRDRQFDGFQFDVEPYLLSDWPTPALRAGYLKLFDTCEDHIRTAHGGLLLGAAVPRWFGAPDLNNLHKAVLDRVDYVAVMDYVSTSKQFVSDPAAIVTYATTVGKKAWLGAEATNLPSEPMATFYAKGNAAMEDAFAAAQKAYSSHAGFAGVCVEYYETYVALKP